MVGIVGEGLLAGDFSGLAEDFYCGGGDVGVETYLGDVELAGLFIAFGLEDGQSYAALCCEACLFGEVGGVANGLRGTEVVCVLLVVGGGVVQVPRLGNAQEGVELGGVVFCIRCLLDVVDIRDAIAALRLRGSQHIEVCGWGEFRGDGGEAAQCYRSCECRCGQAESLLHWVCSKVVRGVVQQ